MTVDLAIEVCAAAQATAHASSPCRLRSILMVHDLHLYSVVEHTTMPSRGWGRTHTIICMLLTHILRIVEQLNLVCHQSIVEVCLSAQATAQASTLIAAFDPIRLTLNLTACILVLLSVEHIHHILKIINPVRLMHSIGLKRTHSLGHCRGHLAIQQLAPVCRTAELIHPSHKLHSHVLDLVACNNVVHACHRCRAHRDRHHENCKERNHVHFNLRCYKGCYQKTARTALLARWQVLINVCSRLMCAQSSSSMQCRASSLIHCHLV